MFLMCEWNISVSVYNVSKSSEKKSKAIEVGSMLEVLDRGNKVFVAKVNLRFLQGVNISSYADAMS